MGFFDDIQASMNRGMASAGRAVDTVDGGHVHRPARADLRRAEGRRAAGGTGADPGGVLHLHRHSS